MTAEKAAFCCEIPAGLQNNPHDTLRHLRPPPRGAGEVGDRALCLPGSRPTPIEIPIPHDQRYDMIFNDSVTTLHGRYHDVLTWRRTRTQGGRMFGHDCIPGSQALAGLEKAAVELGAEVLIHPGTHGLWELRPGNGWDGSGS